MVMTCEGFQNILENNQNMHTSSLETDDLYFAELEQYTHTICVLHYSRLPLVCVFENESFISKKK